MNTSCIRFIALSVMISVLVPHVSFAVQTTRFWDVQAIDTMKYSRDVARAKLRDRSFDATIEAQVKAIAGTGATHVAIATPYDDEFVPFLQRWVTSARKHGLKVWFRGNVSGWEGWFEYPKITRDQHIAQVERFILKYPNLFEDGDVFVGCPECENGGPGDPRMNGDAKGHRVFLIKEHGVMGKAFAKIDKDVVISYNSMNGDVARLIMDKPTTAALGGVVTIDHYVKTVDRLSKDVAQYAKDSAGAVVLGEFGAPIPDIHGTMSPASQAKWVEDALVAMTKDPHVAALNYWTAVGGSTALWDGSMRPRPAVEVLRSFFQPEVLEGRLVNELKDPLSNIMVSTQYRSAISDSNGRFSIPYIAGQEIEISIDHSLYQSVDLTIAQPEEGVLQITLKPVVETWRYKFSKGIRYLASLFHIFSQ